MNVVIGNTSQLSYFFPNNFQKITSRNIPHFEEKINTAYICFAEQRTFNSTLTEKDFIDINVNYTSKFVDQIVDKCERIILYGTAELWNKCDGPIDIKTPINYKYSPYVKSKEILWNHINEKKLRGDWSNVNIIHPFNFNSFQRKEGFLFHKIFSSLMNKTICEVGNVNIQRDIIHPKYLTNKSIYCDCDTIVGSGKLINVKNFINDLFIHYGLKMSDFIKENDIKSNHEGNSFWLNTDMIYKDLLKDTIQELNLLKKYE